MSNDHNDVERSQPTLPRISEIGAVALIVGVLGFATVPAVIKAHQHEQQAEEVTCLSNMKQIGLGMMQYVQDYDEIYPPSYKGAPETWASRIYPYIKSSQIYHCPSDPTEADNSLAPRAVPVSYAENSNLRGKPSKDGKHKGIGASLADLQSPAYTVLFFECEGDRAQVSLPDEGTKNYTSTPASEFVSAAGDGAGSGPEWGYLGKGSGPLLTAGARHMGGSNFGAADGHVKWVLPNAVSSGTNNPRSDGAQDDPKGAAAGTLAGYNFTFSLN